MRGPDAHFPPRSLEGMLKAIYLCLCLVCVPLFGFFPLFGFIYEHCRLSTYLVASPFCRLNWHSSNHLYKGMFFKYCMMMRKVHFMKKDDVERGERALALQLHGN